MQCHYYVIESASGRDQWMVIAEDDDKATALLPSAGGPYKIIGKTDTEECAQPYVAKFQWWHYGPTIP